MVSGFAMTNVGPRGNRVAAAGPGQSDAPSDVELGAASADLLAQGQYFEGGVGEPAEEDASGGMPRGKR